MRFNFKNQIEVVEEVTSRNWRPTKTLTPNDGSGALSECVVFLQGLHMLFHVFFN